MTVARYRTRIRKSASLVLRQTVFLPSALDAGDLDVIGSVLLSALSDPELNRLINEVNQVLHDELFGPTEVDPNVARLRREAKEQNEEPEA